MEDIVQSNGVALRPLGTIDRKVTFKELLDKGYIPFTVKEFIGEDPVEEGKAWLGTKISETPNGEPVTLSDLANKQVHANYSIPCIYIKVKDPAGNELLSYNPCLRTSPKSASYMISLKEAIDAEKLTPFADGKNTVHVYAQLANGEFLEAFNTLLMKGKQIYKIPDPRMSSPGILYLAIFQFFDGMGGFGRLFQINK